MKLVNINKRYREIYERYKDSWANDLYDVYGSFSRDKLNGYNDCRELQQELNGFNFKIIGACSTNFSCGFEYFNRYNKKMFVYMTYADNYEMEVEE